MNSLKVIFEKPEKRRKIAGPRGFSAYLLDCLVGIFFGFSLITFKLFILEENFCPLKFRSHRDASFPLIGRSLRYFLAELLRKNRLKLSNLQKSTKPLEIFT